jgi:hypothetical protein
VNGFHFGLGKGDSEHLSDGGGDLAHVYHAQVAGFGDTGTLDHQRGAEFGMVGEVAVGAGGRSGHRSQFCSRIRPAPK